jgi:hypothetical protein
MIKSIALGFFTVAIIGTGAAWAEAQRQRARPMPSYTSMEPFRAPYILPREVPQYSLPNSGPGSRPHGSYPRGGENGSP